MASHPDRIGKYEILAELGRGGMGTVYKARDPVLDRVVALKTMLGDVLAEPGMRERFLREARSAARLQHPNIVTVFEFGEVEGIPFIAMEFLEGDNLSEAGERGRLPDLASKLGVITQVCDGLGFAHRRGVVHRDVKPSNIYVLPSGTVKIMDFGIAWIEGGTTTTRTGEVLGTPAYMAPEQFSGQPVDYRVDIWAVGVILYELLTGRKPFDANTVGALIYQIVHAPPAPIDPRQCPLPAHLLAVVELALAKDPRQRFQDLADLARALHELGGDLPTASHLLSAPGPKPAIDSDVTLSNTPFALPDVPPASETRGLVMRQVPRPPTSGRVVFIDEGTFGETRKVQTLLLSLDDSVLVAGGMDGSIHVWDLATRTKISTLRNRVHMRTGHGSLTTCLTFSGDGSLLASGHLDGAIYLWEVATGLELDVRLGHEGAVGGLAFPPGDGTLISAGADATIKFWDLPALRSGDARRTMRRQPDAVTCLGLADGGKLVVTGHAGRTLRAHEIASQKLVATLHGHHATPSALAVSPSGNLVASGARDGAVLVHHLETREQRGGHHEHSRSVAGLAFFPDGQRVASVAMNNTVVVWDLNQPELPITLSGPAGESFAGVCVTGDGRRLICASADGRFRVWLAPGQSA
jgi:serine/threonine protein kinase/WD40 repeat protein